MRADFRTILHRVVEAESDLVVPLDGCEVVWRELIKEATEALSVEPLQRPSGYAYRYPCPFGGTVLRFNSGQEVNGCRPNEVVPYWFAPPEQVAALDAEPTEAW